MPSAQREILFHHPSLWDCIFPQKQTPLATTFLSDAFWLKHGRQHPQSGDAPKSLWLPQLSKAGNRNASAQGLSASLSFFFPQQQQRHFKGMAINCRLIQPDWLLGALKNWYHTYRDRSRDITWPQSPTLRLFQKYQCSQHVRIRKENVETSNI